MAGQGQGECPNCNSVGSLSENFRRLSEIITQENLAGYYEGGDRNSEISSQLEALSEDISVILTPSQRTINQPQATVDELAHEISIRLLSISRIVEEISRKGEGIVDAEYEAIRRRVAHDLKELLLKLFLNC